ncbi:MAG TPA: hypothetical protein VGC40_06110 [Paenirhodobacter sp.]
MAAAVTDTRGAVIILRTVHIAVTALRPMVLACLLPLGAWLSARALCLLAGISAWLAVLPWVVLSGLGLLMLRLVLLLAIRGAGLALGHRCALG